MATESLTVSAIFARLGEVIGENKAELAVCVVGLAAANILLDEFASESASGIPAAIASVAAQYHLIRTALVRRQLYNRVNGSGFWSFIGVNIMSGIAITLGLILLIIPGLYLNARWSAASAGVLAEDQTASGALSDSWAMTERSVWPILGIALVIFVPMIVFAGGISYLLDEVQPMLSSIITYLALFGAFAVSWLSGVAIYSLLRSRVDDLAEVFA